MTPIRLVGVYDADGGVIGEIRYVIGHLLGHAHCTLCEITHGPLRKRKVFTDLEQRSAVPIELRHRNEISAAERAACGDQLPCVLIETTEGIEILLGPDDLATAHGDVNVFEALLAEALARR